ncbi:MAG: dockerin type I repeat-containing protein, partial [Oscillospiraceae bacterium]|nr:dockerin type I repeat-containing protein [Oscillospiraceae bacterium]
IYALAGSLLLSCDVQVTEAFYYSIRDEGAITITDPDDQVFLLYPDSEGLVTWISTNPTVVSVDKNGKLTSQMNGSAQILATSNGVTMMRAVIVDFTADSTENSSSVQASGTAEEPKREIGDVTGDGEIGLVDVIKINRNLLGLDSLTQQQITAADAYHDGTVNSTDSLTILRYCVSLVEELPVEP